MGILARYIFREYLIPLGYCLCGFLSIYVLFELFGSFSRLMAAKLPIATAVRYFLAYLAPYFEWLAPAALMLAALYTMWSFCRHSELVAMRANGVSFLVIARPILFVATLMAVFVHWVNDSYVPEHAQWARLMKTHQFDLARVSKAEDIVYRNQAESRTWLIGGLADTKAEHLKDVRISVDWPDRGVRRLKISAERADYLDGQWWFTGLQIQHYDSRGHEIASPTPELDALPLRHFPEFREDPADFRMLNHDWACNSLRERFRYLETHPGLDAREKRKCRYDIIAKILSPFACLVITLFAIPAGVVSGRQSVFRGILTALVMFFAFYALVIGGMVSVDRGWLPPLVAAALPYVTFTVLGVRSFVRLR